MNTLLGGKLYISSVLDTSEPVSKKLTEIRKDVILCERLAPALFVELFSSFSLATDAGGTRTRSSFAMQHTYQDETANEAAHVPEFMVRISRTVFGRSG
jgi:hypothetical protein